MIKRELVRALKGRRIVDVRLNRFATHVPGHPWATDPILTLDDGTRLCFITEETDVGRYGTRILVLKP